MIQNPIVAIDIENDQSYCEGSRSAKKREIEKWEVSVKNPPQSALPQHSKNIEQHDKNFHNIPKYPLTTKQRTMQAAS